jgi:glycosyltransferase involved in cell wall biosynthesis
MLSILIPTYNYDTFQLVKELHNQVTKECIEFEIIVSDDASSNEDLIARNKEILQLSNCQYYQNETNLGRGPNRNKLCEKANYDWILLLDCDNMPTSDLFVKKYIDCIKSKNSVAFSGGLQYEDGKPNDDEILRWIYGKKREAIPFERRQAKMYESSLVSNILLKKQLLIDYPFNSSIYDYGFEDFVFIAELKKNNIPITHLDNPVFHINLEKSDVFLQKHLTAINTLNQLIKQKIINADDTHLSKARKILSRFRLISLTKLLFKTFESLLRKNLISNKPSLLLFDFYKLGYFCTLKDS